MDKDTIAGKVKEVGGKFRGAVDHATGDKQGEAQARKDEVEGNVQKHYGKIKDAIKDAVDD